MIPSPPTVRAKKRFTGLVKGAALVFTTLHMGSWAYSSITADDLSTGRFLTEDEDNRDLREVQGQCGLDMGGGCNVVPVEFYESPRPNGEELNVLQTPDFCIDRTDWWITADYARFCEGGFVDGECPKGNCHDRAGLALLVELEPEIDEFNIAEDEAANEFNIAEDEAADQFNIAEDEDANDGNPAAGNDNGAGGVNGDPLFIGIRGQVFKFDGKSDTWYANLATESVQWNLLFNEFDTCPEHENMFVTKASLSLRNSDNQITVGVLDNGNFLPGCADNTVCLGEGSLGLEINGQVIRSPGEYELANNAGRVVIHNTYASCSRKWYDYVVSTKYNLRNLIRDNDYQESAMDLLLKHKGEMLDPEDCQSWLEKREQNGDLFSQNGSWTTVHIETKEISLHMEYRQSNEDCNSHLIDAWISKVSPELLAQEWKGVLGETRYAKLNADGSQVVSDRNALLAGQNDEDYEVEGPYEINFAARDIFSVDSSSIAIE